MERLNINASYFDALSERFTDMTLADWEEVYHERRIKALKNGRISERRRMIERVANSEIRFFGLAGDEVFADWIPHHEFMVLWPDWKPRPTHSGEVITSHIAYRFRPEWVHEMRVAYDLLSADL